MYMTVMCFHRSRWFSGGLDYTGDNDGFHDVVRELLKASINPYKSRTEATDEAW